jgi:hypothetical protein
MQGKRPIAAAAAASQLRGAGYLDWLLAEAAGCTAARPGRRDRPSTEHNHGRDRQLPVVNQTARAPSVASSSAGP